MKFGRRGRSRSRDPIWARRSGNKTSDDTVIEVPPTEGSAAPAVDFEQDEIESVTNEILTHLEHFARECADPGKPLWSDACMNELIICMEIAIEQSWAEVACVLEDTGRILQTYENADCPEKAAPFLSNAYNVLCTMIGDIVVEKPMEEIVGVWDALLVSGLEDLANNGLSLYDDSESEDEVDSAPNSDTVTTSIEEEDSEAADEAHSAAIEQMIQQVEQDIPIESDSDEAGKDQSVDSVEELESESNEPEPAEPESEISLSARSDDFSELPTLEALPPLEDLVEINMDDTEQASDDVEHSQPEATEESVSEEIKRRVETPAENPDEQSFALFSMPRAEALASDGTMDEVPEELSTPESKADAEETADQPVESTDEQDVDETEVFDPPRIVVDIIDRICDVLSQIESMDERDRDGQLSIMAGGLEALGHEAKVMGSESALNACRAMTQACDIVRDQSKIPEAFIENGFAFCGVFIEALGDPSSENIAAWQQEIDSWLRDPNPDDNAESIAAPTEQSEVQSVDESPIAGEDTEPEEPVAKHVPPVLTLFEAPREGAVNPMEETLADESSTDEAIAEGTDNEPESPSVTEQSAEQEPTEIKPETDSDTVDHAAESQALLQAAQLAATSGNGDEAKTLALRAAAEIAKAEVQRAEFSLREAEIKLKESVEFTSEARKCVNSCEGAVRDAASRVEESRSSHAESQQTVGQVAEKLESLEAGVIELNRQIQELQAKRDAEVEKVAGTVTELEHARQTEVKSHAEWEELKELESDTRQRLEEARQNVKEKQRGVQKIESDMERAREILTQQKVSLSDITQAIQQISGSDAGDPTMQEDGMLF